MQAQETGELDDAEMTESTYCTKDCHKNYYDCQYDYERTHRTSFSSSPCLLPTIAFGT